MNELITQVEQWSIAKNLHKSDPAHQMLKSLEELGETAKAIVRVDVNPNAIEDVKDGIGDTIVTLIILAQQFNLTIEECLACAYAEIADRKGKTVNGVFIKESDLGKGDQDGLS